MIELFGKQFKNFNQLRKFLGYGAITQKMAIDRSGSLEEFVKTVLKVDSDEAAVVAFNKIEASKNDAVTMVDTDVYSFLLAFWILADEKAKEDFIKIYKVTNKADIDTLLSNLNKLIEEN